MGLFMCHSARLRYGWHSNKVAARIHEVSQQLIIEEGKVHNLASGAGLTLPQDCG